MMLGIAAAPALLQLLGMFCMPESQRWLAKKKRYSKCQNVLSTVYHDDDYVQAELIALQEEVAAIPTEERDQTEGGRIR